MSIFHSYVYAVCGWTSELSFPGIYTGSVGRVLSPDHLCYLILCCVSWNVRFILPCSHLLLKKITEMECGTYKVSKATDGGGKGGEVDTSSRENITLFRLTTDAIVKVHCVYLTTRTS